MCTYCIDPLHKQGLIKRPEMGSSSGPAKQIRHCLVSFFPSVFGSAGAACSGGLLVLLFSVVADIKVRGKTELTVCVKQGEPMDWGPETQVTLGGSSEVKRKCFQLT